VLAQPDVRERLLAVGVDVVGSTPEELARFQRAEMEKWARIVKDSGAKVD
jgi:tripartite-type tricarboxylate transporter receptor subunit TctC